MWKYRGQERPDFAVVPKSGRESVWDYPRPPKLTLDDRPVEVFYADRFIASSNGCYRVLETASPPSFYIPPSDVNWKHLSAASGSSVCEWKGTAKYWAILSNPKVIVGWSYPRPAPAFEKIRDYLSLYPGVCECFVAKEPVQAQPGKFYGGWITSEIIGPFKGEPGTEHW